MTGTNPVPVMMHFSFILNMDTQSPKTEHARTYTSPATILARYTRMLPDLQNINSSINLGER